MSQTKQDSMNSHQSKYIDNSKVELDSLINNLNTYSQEVGNKVDVKQYGSLDEYNSLVSTINLSPLKGEDDGKVADSITLFLVLILLTCFYVQF